MQPSRKCFYLVLVNIWWLLAAAVMLMRGSRLHQTDASLARPSHRISIGKSCMLLLWNLVS
jgi:hypothetical protein